MDKDLVSNEHKTPRKGGSEADPYRGLRPFSPLQQAGGILLTQRTDGSHTSKKRPTFEAVVRPLLHDGNSESMSQRIYCSNKRSPPQAEAVGTEPPALGATESS